jgi:hypothetical protein
MCCEYQAQYGWYDIDPEVRYFPAYDDATNESFTLYYHTDVRWCPYHYWRGNEYSQFGFGSIPLPLNVITVMVDHVL